MMIKDAVPQTNGFPIGYFILRSVATNRLLDVKLDGVADGTECILWPEKESSLLESVRNPAANNQVFYIDTSGALCCRASGHAIDVEGDRLVLRHRRPVSTPFPNAYSHHLPKFSYNSNSQEISVTFASDPSYPPPTEGTPSNAWRSKSYILSSIPVSRGPSVIDDASAFIASAFSTSFSFLAPGASDAPKSTPADVFDGEIDLNDDQVLEQERGEEGEADDSPQPHRMVRVLTLGTGDERLGEQAKLRRKWQVVSLRRLPAAHRLDV